jgi:hypothetical protein
MYQLTSKKRRAKTVRKKQIIEDGEEEEEEANNEGANTMKEVAVEGVRWDDDEASEWDGDP